MRFINAVRYSSLAAALAGAGWAQTQIDLRTQAKSVNFSAASSTLPSQTGAVLPATCQTGATFILTTSIAGQNWYICTSANQWTLQTAPLPSMVGNSGAVLSNNGASLQWSALGGDVSGAPGAVTVNRLLGRSLNTTAPSTGQFLGWNGSQWAAQTVSYPVTSLFGRTGAITAQTGDYSFSQISGTASGSQLPASGGDLSGAITAATVARLQGRALSSAAPSTGQVIAWNGTQWAPQSVSGGVASVFGRTGAVTAQTGDYTFAQISGAASPGQLPQTGGDLSGGITSATVTRIQSMAVSNTMPAAGQVLTWSGSQWAPQNAAGAVSTVFGRSGAVNAQSGDYAAAQVTNAVDATQANSYVAGARQSFNASVTGAGLQLTPGPLPTTPLAGDMAVDSGDSNKVKIYNGASWVSLNPNIPPGNYTAFFTNSTVVSITGTAHGLGTSNLIVQCFDNSSPVNMVEPSQITIDPVSYNVTVTFAAALTGRCVLNGYNGSSSSAGSGGAGMATQLGDFDVAWNSPATLAIGGHCSATTPCNVRFGTQIYSIQSPSTVTLAAGTGVAYIYVDANGVVNVGSSLTVTCAAGCVTASGISGFPVNTVPIYSWTASNGMWDSNGGVDQRGWLSASPVLGGSGIAAISSAGQTVISVDSAVVPTYLTASASLTFPTIPTGTCAADLTFALPGANPGDAVAPGWPATLPAGLSGTMRISAGGTVSVRLCADAAGAATPPAATYTATVIRGF